MNDEASNLPLATIRKDDMQSVQLQREEMQQTGRRRGIVAMNEIVLILVILIGTASVLCHALTIADNCDGNASLAASRAAIRPVYDLSLDQTHLWVHRLREDLVRVDLGTRDIVKSLPTMNVQLASVAYGTDGAVTLVYGADGLVVLYRGAEIAAVHKLLFPSRFALAVDGDDAVIVNATENGHVTGWKFKGMSSERIAFDVVASSQIISVGVNPRGSRMFVARRDGTVTFHALGPYDNDRIILDAGTGGLGFAWSQDERLFAVVSDSCEVRLFDLASGCIISRGTLDAAPRHTSVTKLKISPDGRRVAVSTDASPVIQVWTVDATRPILRLCGHTGIVHSLEFSADSDRLYSGGCDGVIREWSLKTGMPLRTID